MTEGGKLQRSKSRLKWVNSGEELALNMSLKACVIQIPKYFNFCGLTLSGNKPKSVCLAAVFTGITSHFWRLILYPDILPNSSSRFRNWDRYKSIWSTGTPYHLSHISVFPLYWLHRVMLKPVCMDMIALISSSTENGLSSSDAVLLSILAFS